MARSAVLARPTLQLQLLRVPRWFNPGHRTLWLIEDLALRGKEAVLNVYTSNDTALSFNLTGCYAEKVKRKASEVLSFPERLSFAQAATGSLCVVRTRRGANCRTAVAASLFTVVGHPPAVHKRSQKI
jgi:hypothetical protein